MSRRLRSLATITFGAIVCVAASFTQAQSMDQLYEKAKLEKELVIYGGGPTTLYEVPARAFEQKYPGIKVTIHAGFSNVLDEKINEQLESKKLDVDLAILQTVQDFIRWKKEDVLARFKLNLPTIGMKIGRVSSRLCAAISGRCLCVTPSA